MARRSADERTLVDVQIKLEAHLEQQTALDDSGRNIRRADSTKKNRIKSSQLIQYVIRQDFAIAQETCSAEVEVGGVNVDSGRSDHFEGLDSDFGSDAVSADHGNTVRCCCCHKSHIVRATGSSQTFDVLVRLLSCGNSQVLALPSQGLPPGVTL